MYKIGHIAKDRRPHLTNNVIGDPEVHDQEWARQEKMVSFAGYPLIVEDRLVGVMAMFFRQPLTDFSLKALSSVADNISIGIERKNNEKEKERYVEAINKATDGITIADEIDRYIYVNTAYANIFGYSQDELMGKTWRKITPPDLIPSIETGISHTIHNKNVGVFYGEVPGLRKDGTILPTEVTGTGFWDEDGSYRGHVCIVRDITERKQNNEKMKQSEEKYRDLFENANDSICILGPDMKYKDVNNKTVEMLGYTREELLNMSVYDLIPSEQLPISENEFNKLKKEGSYEKFVGKVRTKDGRLIYVEVSSSVIKEEGRVIGSRDIIRDITERVQNEEALRESEERYRTIIEHSNDMIWTLDNEGHFLFFNKRSEEITGSTLMEWLGKSFTPFIENEDLPRVMYIFNNALNGQPQQYEVSVRKTDGSILTLSVNSAPIYSKGKVIGTVNFGRDITESMQIEKALEESEEQYRSLFENSPISLWEEDLSKVKTYIDSLRNKGVEDFRIYFESHPEEVDRCSRMVRVINVNNATVSLFRARSKEELLKDINQIFSEHSLDIFREELVAISEGRTAFEGEDLVKTLTGDNLQIYMKWSVAPGYEETYSRRQVSIIDITERIRIEEQIKNSLKEKEVLLREVYHRVKNNMQIITSLLKLQSRYVKEGEYREMFRESLDRIKSMSLVHEKLYQSKDLSTIDFKEYLNEIARGLFLSYGANEGKISLVMNINNISLDINTAIPCGLIINELVTNSLKHAFPDGKDGEIKIAIHSMNENTIELVVGDNGAGISEDLDFKKTESLGLQLVTMLAENQLHGEIILDRSKGTEFTITFKEVK
jgi:PAS domain S-box-containing protein